MLEYQSQLDLAFHALADATRRGMLERLSRGPASVSELAAPYDSTLAAIHQHVRVLEASGLIVTEKRGRTRECRISAEAVESVFPKLATLAQPLLHPHDRLGQLLEGEAGNHPGGLGAAPDQGGKTS